MAEIRYNFVAMGKIIEVKDLRFAYDKTDVIDGLSFSIEEGEYVEILGPNGSGKSTLAKLLIGLLPLKEGEIFVKGIRLSEETAYDIRNKIGIVFQNPDNQFIGATVRDDIAFGLENHCVKQEDMDTIIEEYAAKVGMSDYLDQEPSKLSGGQKQRVAIAGVLAMKPEILIFDEATSMLDPEGKYEIQEMIREIHKKENLTLITVSHDLDEALMCDKAIVLDKGKLVRYDTPENVFSDSSFLKKHDLDVPFVLSLRNDLKKEGIVVDKSLSLKELAKNICRYSSKK